MAPPTTASASAPAQQPNWRPRGQVRRRQKDEAAYAGPSAGAKRLAGEPSEGDGRVKRRRVDAPLLLPPAIVGPHGRAGKADGETKAHLVDFSTLPSDALYRYLIHYDLIPQVFPSPLTAQDPSPPSTLLQPHRSASRVPSPPLGVTPANRPRRESREQSRRRSSRAVEEGRVRTPILADVEEAQGVLAAIAQRHWEEQVVKEVDTLALFLCAVKTKGAPAGLPSQSQAAHAM